MIKILFFIEELRGGGAEKVLCNLVNEMDPNQFEITVQTLWKGNSQELLLPRIHDRYCYASESRFNRYRSRIEAQLGLTYRLYIKGDYEIEVAYLEFGSTKIISKSNNRSAKKVAWVHSDLAKKLSAESDDLQKLKNQYAAFDKIVCVSKTAKKSFVELFGRDSDTDVLYNTVDDEAIRKKAAFLPTGFPPKNNLTAVSVGRLSKEKQFPMLLRVHKRLLADGLQHTLWIVGEGSEREALERYIAENKLSDSVFLQGYQTNPYPFMKAADLLVCSSGYEGLSTFITEGLILGKPIVTTECSGMRELLGNSDYGLIVDNQEEALYRGLRQMLADADLRAVYAAHAAERGRDFSARQLAKETEGFFIQLLKD